MLPYKTEIRYYANGKPIHPAKYNKVFSSIERKAYDKAYKAWKKNVK